jgi:2-polyprenyl-3-methyl-5-hydroxy-6-metoxy-1,4-benzoquinol methylase
MRGLVSAGLEVSSAGVARALASHPSIDVRLHSVEVLPWPVDPESWDVVTAFEVIEHLLEPRALLEGARSALVTGGALALSTPYHGLVKNLVIAALGFDRHFAVDGDHVRFFTDRALRRLLDEHGFRIVETAHFGRIGPLWANTTVWAVKT